MFRGVATLVDAREGRSGPVEAGARIAVCDRAWRSRERLGVTRVANLTGLDRLGVPVAAAYRPNSRSIAVFQGKGLTAADARAGALMEATEVFHAETIERPLRLARYAELGDSALDPERLPRCTASLYDRDLAILWVAGRDLVSGDEVWVPQELVTADFTLPQPTGSYCFAAGTNGLASGPTRVAAITHALLELIERDAVSLWRLLPPAVRRRTRIDPTEIAAPVARALLERFTAAGVPVELWDATSDLGVPTCFVESRDTEAPDVPDIGSAAHPDPGAAMARALLELAQTRLTRIAGARDDLAAWTYDRDPPPLGARGYPRDDDAFADLVAAGESPRAASLDMAMLERLLAMLVDHDLTRVAWVDLAKPELDIPVARVVVPGLEGISHTLSADYVPGARARAAQVRAT